MKNLVLTILADLLGLATLVGIALTYYLPFAGNVETHLDICFALEIASLICGILGRC